MTGAHPPFSIIVPWVRSLLETLCGAFGLGATTRMYDGSNDRRERYDKSTSWIMLFRNHDCWLRGSSRLMRQMVSGDYRG